MYVEEYETEVLKLENYVSGGLVNYKLDISYDNDTANEPEKEELTDIANFVIRVTRGSESQAHLFLNNTDLASVMEPFPRSTVMLDDIYGNLMMYFVDRSFYFNSYCLEGYLDKNMVQGQLMQLDRTIITGQCSNLKHVLMNDQK